MTIEVKGDHNLAEEESSMQHTPPSSDEVVIPLVDVATQLDLGRGNIYRYLKFLKIKPRRYRFHRQSYITRAEMERIRDAKEGKLLIPLDEGEEEKHQGDAEGAVHVTENAVNRLLPVTAYATVV